MSDHDCRQEDKIQKLCEFKGATEAQVKTLFTMVQDIRDNHLKHINTKINALLFTVLAGVFIAILSWGLKFIYGK